MIQSDEQGALAQLVARNAGSVEVRGSNPLRSIFIFINNRFLYGDIEPDTYNGTHKTIMPDK